MKKFKFIKKFAVISTLSIMALLVNTGGVNAALQSNQNTQYTKADIPTNWMSNFRQMETTGGAMGLSETLNTDLTSSSSNNIDVHMMKSTEYGAIAILSASGYGNSSNSNAITTTTGNATGVMLKTSEYEWVAGGLSSFIFSGVNGKYFDTYTGAQTSARVGDALGNSTTTNPGAAGWHTASYSAWVDGNNSYFFRGNGGIFSFNYYYAGYSNSCRGVAVCGAGL